MLYVDRTHTQLRDNNFLAGLPHYQGLRISRLSGTAAYIGHCQRPLAFLLTLVLRYTDRDIRIGDALVRLYTAVTSRSAELPCYIRFDANYGTLRTVVIERQP